MAYAPVESLFVPLLLLLFWLAVIGAVWYWAREILRQLRAINRHSAEIARQQK